MSVNGIGVGFPHGVKCERHRGMVRERALQTVFLHHP